MGGQDTLLQEFSDMFASNRWPGLGSLEVNGAHLSQETLIKALGTVECAPSLGLIRSDFGPANLDVLLQSQALKVVRIMEFEECNVVTSLMDQQILSSCPSLQSFSVDKLSSAYILEIINDSTTRRSKDSWVCLGLVSLAVRITI